MASNPFAASTLFQPRTREEAERARKPLVGPEEKAKANAILNAMFPNATGAIDSSRADQAAAFQAGDPFRVAGALARQVGTVPLGTAQDIFSPVMQLGDAAFRAGDAFVGGVTGAQAPKREPGKVTGNSFGHFSATGPASSGYQPSSLYSKILGLEGGIDKKTGRFLTSSAGAYGPAQLMPGTAPEALKLAGYKENDSRWRTDPVVNMRAGEAYFNKQLQTFGDPALAAAAYNAGPGAVQKALERGGATGWLALLPAETQNYVKNFTGAGPGALGQLPDFQNPFNPQAWQGILGQVDRATGAALQPFSADIERPDAPAFPDRPEMPVRDFSETDALLETLRPVMIGEMEQKKVKRASFFEGLAQGMSSIPDGAGLGKVLGQLGAGMMAGRAAGDKEIQARMDRFDEKMAAFNLMQFEYGGKKAEQLHREAAGEVLAMYQHNLAKFQNDMQQWQRDYTFQQSGNYIVATKRKEGGLAVDYIPLTPMIKAAGEMAKVGVLGNAAQAEQQGASMEASATNQMLGSQYMLDYTIGAQQRVAGQQAGAQGGLEGVAGMGAVLSGELVRSGQWTSMVRAGVGEEGLQAFDQEINQALRLEGVMEGTPEYAERKNEMLTSRMTGLMMTNPEFSKQMQKQAPALLETWMGRRLQDGKTTETTNSRGQSTFRREY